MAALAALSILPYGGVRSHGFVYDDLGYLVRNPEVQAGLTPRSLRWAFTTFHEANWHPVTWLSHLLDIQLLGMAPGGHHLVNLLLHAANTILLFLALRSLTGAVWRSSLAAALFAIHPLHVESVAWVAERKDLLSALWFFLGLLAYVRYVRRPTVRRYLSVAAIFALGLLSKPMVVTFPFVLLLLDLWPLRRHEEEPGVARLLHLIVEKTPLFILSFISAAITFRAHREALAAVNLSLETRLGNALVSYLLYLWKTAWPGKLAAFYPHPAAPTPWWALLGSGLLLAGISLAVALVFRRAPHLAVGWFLFVGMMVPVIGIVQVGGQARADRYTYLPLVGLFLALAWTLGDLAGRRRVRIALAMGSLIVIAALTAATVRQTSFWQDEFTLFSHALEVTDDNWLAHNNVGTALLEQGRYGQARQHFAEAVRIAPGFLEAQNNLGWVLARQGFDEEAELHLRAAISLNPSVAAPHATLGEILLRRGKTDEALDHLREALRLNPDFEEARFAIERALARRGPAPAF